MNLTAMLKDASLNDFQWLLREDTVIPKDKDNNIKDDLEIQWGLQDIDPKYQEEQEKIHVIDSPDQKNQTGFVVQKVRQMLNQGMNAAGIMPKLYDGINTYDIQNAAPDIDRALKGEGIVGCIAVDVTGYKNIKQAMQDAAKSPYKKFIKYVIGYTGEPIYVPMSEKSLINKELTGSSKNAFDDFFASDKNQNKVVAYCKELMMPILAGYQDIYDEDRQDTFIDLLTVGAIDEDEIKQIKESGLNNLQQIQAAFKLAFSKRNPKASTEKVDISEHKVKAGEMTVDIAAIAKPDLKVAVQGSKAPLGLGKIDMQKVQAAFKNAKEHKTEKINAAEHKLKTNELVVDIAAAVKPELKVSEQGPMEAIELSKMVTGPDVKCIKESKLEEIDIPKVADDLNVVNEPKPFPVVEILQCITKPIDVDPVDHELDQEIYFNDPLEFKPVEINPTIQDNEIVFDGIQQELDVEPDTFIEEEFKDADKIILESPKPKKPLDINLAGGLNLND